MGILQDSTTVFRFDGSDLMPASVGAGTFWKGMVDWINGKDTASTLTYIEAPGPSRAPVPARTTIVRAGRISKQRNTPP